MSDLKRQRKGPIGLQMNFVDRDDYKRRSLFSRVATKKVARKLRANCCNLGGGSFRLTPALAVVLLSTMHNKEEISTENEKRSHR